MVTADGFSEWSSGDPIRGSIATGVVEQALGIDSVDWASRHSGPEVLRVRLLVELGRGTIWSLSSITEQCLIHILKHQDWMSGCELLCEFSPECSTVLLAEFGVDLDG